MLKKLGKVLLMVSLFIGGGFLFSNEQANASNWDYVNGSCTARVHTQYNTYSSSATTLNAWATQNGNCGTLYYKMEIKDQWGHNQSTQVHTGYFNSSTPWKAFDLSRVKTYRDPSGRISTAYYVEVTLYSDSARTRYLGRANKLVQIYR